MRTLLRLFTVGLLITAVICTTAGAEEPAWKIGLASVNITPIEPVRMAGYAGRTQSSQGVAAELFAKAMAIEDSQGHRAVLVTSDVIGFRAAFTEPTCRLIVAKTGLGREQTLLNSSHTHTGPNISLEAEDLDYDGEQAAATVRYSKRLQEQLVELAAESLTRLEPARLSWGVGVVTFVMNRREFTANGVILGFNPRGHADRSVPVLRIDTPDGKLRGVLFGAACHNTTLTGNDLAISADFAGYAQSVIEREHPGVQAMFMQGCAGDANPHPRGNEDFARLHGHTLGDEVLRVLKTKLQPVRGPLGVAHANVEIPLQSPPTREELDKMIRGGSWRKFIAEKMVKVLDAGESLPTSYSSPIAVWQFGDDLTLVGLPGEVVVDYVTMLEKRLGPNRLWVAAYCNDVFGYLPSARVLEEGGYETRGLYYGGVGLFSPKAQDAVVEKVDQLAEQLGRKR
jgi:neutral ceramidase